MDLQEIFKLTKLESLKALQLYAKQLVHSMQSGSHQSARRGSGIEFKEYKNYNVGDSLKQLDWKYYARTDHYMIKEAEVERLHEYLFALDRSASMNLEANGISKFNYAKAIIASLAYIADRQHDDYALYNGKNDFTDYTEFVYQCLAEETEKDFDNNQLSPTSQRTNRATSFIITDAYYDLEELESCLKKWTFAADQVVLVHLLFETEIKLSVKKQHYRFQDLETGEMIEVNTKEQLAEYQDKLSQWHLAVKDCCAQYRVLYHHYDGTKAINGFILNLVSAMNNSL